MVRVWALAGVRFVLTGLLVALLAACFVGRADASSLLSPSVVNSAASGPSVVAGDRALTLKWSAVKGAAGYRVSWRGRVFKAGKPTSDWSAKWHGTKALPASARSFRVSGLLNGAQYQLRFESLRDARKWRWVAERTLIGMPVRIVPEATVPGAPTSVVGYANTASVQVFWTAPASDGGSTITGYTATASGDGLHRCSTSGARGCVVFNLTNGLPYTFTVVATNAKGSSATSAASLPVVPGSCFLGYLCRVSPPRLPPDSSLDPRT
jgi:hypothetical protein